MVTRTNTADARPPSADNRPERSLIDPAGQTQVEPGPPQRPKESWIEYLRVVAAIGVVTTHATAVWYYRFGSEEPRIWWIANVLNALSRFAVPMFVMISGAVLLGRPSSLETFYSRRLRRLLPAILFWSVFYALFGLATGSGDVRTAIWQVTVGLFVLGNANSHLWYLSMFLCLMAFAPFLNDLVLGNKPGPRQFVVLAILCTVLMALDQASIVLRQTRHLDPVWFKSFPWFIVYFLLGYALDRHRDQLRIRNDIIVGTLIGTIAAAVALNYCAARYLGIVSDSFVLANEGVFDFVVTVAIFMLFSQNRARFRTRRWVDSASATTFGIYLIHPAILKLLEMPLGDSVRHASWFMLAHIAAGFAISCSVILVLRKSWVFRQIT